MLVRVLGSAAGGGFPQWNCGCPNCRGVREGTLRATPRSQECVAVSADGAGSWVLLNCSPEIRAQVESFPSLHPRAPRHSPIAAILLTNGDLDHCLGLLSLRESHPLVVYATESVQRGFTQDNVLYRTLERFPGQVTWRRVKPGREEDIIGVDGRPTGLAFNMAYGIQGECRYTHGPALLETAGIPYTGSGPFGHALALDKVVTKTLMIAAGIPTPRYAVLGDGSYDDGGLRYPLVVKPRHESTSFGLALKAPAFTPVTL